MKLYRRERERGEREREGRRERERERERGEREREIFGRYKPIYMEGPHNESCHLGI